MRDGDRPADASLAGRHGPGRAEKTLLAGMRGTCMHQYEALDTRSRVAITLRDVAVGVGMDVYG